MLSLTITIILDFGRETMNPDTRAKITLYAGLLWAFLFSPFFVLMNELEYRQLLKEMVKH